MQEIDLEGSVEGSRRKLIDAAGAGASVTSPGWLTQLGRLYGGKSVSNPTFPRASFSVDSPHSVYALAFRHGENNAPSFLCQES